MKKTKRTTKKSARASKKKTESLGGWLSVRQLRELRKAARASLLPVNAPGAEIAFRLTTSGVVTADREYEIPQFVIAANARGFELMSRIFAYMAASADASDLDGSNSRALFVGDGAVNPNVSDECVLRMAAYNAKDKKQCLQMWRFRASQ